MGNPTLLLYVVTALVLAAIGYYAFRPVPQMSEHYAEEATIIPPVEVPVDLNPFTCNAEGVCFRSDSPTHVEVASKDPKKRFKVHAGVDMVAPLTINGNLVATAAEVEKVRYPGPKGDAGAIGPEGPMGKQGVPGAEGPMGTVGPKGDTGPIGPKGFDGKDGTNGVDGLNGINGKDGAPGMPGATGPKGDVGPMGPVGSGFNPATMHEVVKTKKLQLGDKFMLSANGDAHANDDWLRMFDKDGKGYNGGFAAGRLWTPTFYSNSADVAISGRLNVARGDGNWNWIRVSGNHGDNLYMGSDGGNRGIWADGNRDLNLYNKGINALSVKQNGDVSVNNNLNVNGKVYLTPGGGHNTDYYSIEKKHTSSDQSHMRITINDNTDESLQIWGDSCRTTGCGGAGVPRFKFFADGRLCIGDTCITETDLQNIKKRGEGTEGIKFARGQTTVNDWRDYGNANMYVDVNIAPYKFTQTPTIVTSIHGVSSHWTTSGASSVYSASPTTFRIYILRNGVTMANAKAWGWVINWVAYGV